MQTTTKSSPAPSRRAYGLAVLITCLLASAGCGGGGGGGVCVSGGGTSSSFRAECKETFTEKGCTDFDTRQVDDGHWTWYGDQACADEGFTHPCCNSYTFTRTASDCGCD